MSKYNVMICDHIHDKGIELLSKQSDITVTNVSNLPKDELLEVIKDADVAITRSSTEINETFIDAAINLKALVRAGVGVDNVNIDACSKRGIVAMNVPTANTIAAVELTMAHILSCVRNFPKAHDELKNERVWKRENWYGTELKDKKLGIIGFGNIGSRVGIRAKAFEMDVITYDPYINPNKATDLNVKYTKDFNEILQCDIITIHTPKNKETINMIGKDEIHKMKEGVILINCARGGLYNEDALYEGIQSKKIRVAGIDVFTKEPATDNRLLDLENIYVTPHLGANTLESQEKIAIQAAEQAMEAARGVSYPNALNLPIKENEIPPFVKPYLELVQKISFLGSQANKGSISSIKVTTEGEISRYKDSLSTFALVGALRSSLGENVNYVNATYVANERGIKIESIEAPNQSGYKNRITVKIATEKEAFKISGTVFDEEVQRVVDINGFALDVEPKGKMILFQNTDVPGVIGEIGTILSKHSINISDFRLGRNKHGHALAVILIDDDATKEILEELQSIKAFLSIAYAIL